MHELSIAEGIVEVVERTARQNAVTRVKKVRVAIGELAGVDIPSLRFAWDSVTKDGVAQGALLDIDRPPGQAGCMDWSVNVPLKNFGEACPHCGGYHLTPTGGREMRVLELIAD